MSYTLDGVVLVGFGWNQAFIPIGAFAGRAQAEEALLAAGAEWEPNKKWDSKLKKIVPVDGQHLVTTKAFCDWMEAHELCFYSTGPDFARERIAFVFQNFPIGGISHGYDDD